jgi:transposase-like protein
LSTPAGDLEVGIPKLRKGSFFPELLEPRRRIDKALWAVIMTAYITGTSTRKVDELVKALGCDTGISKSSVSRICKGIDGDVSVLRQRRLDHQPFVYVWLDATYVHVREAGQVVSKAVVIATGLRADGHREVLGVDVGDSENENVLDRVPPRSQRPRPCRLEARDLGCPRRTTSRHQTGATERRLAPLQRRPARLRVLPARTLVQNLVQQPDRTPQPGAQRRTDVVQIFPNTESVIRLVGALLVEINDEMIAAERRYIAAASVAAVLEDNDRLPSLPAAPRN